MEARGATAGARGRTAWKNLKRRIRLNPIRCCGSSWSFGNPSMFSTQEEHHEPLNSPLQTVPLQVPSPAESCVAQAPGTMNLATALAVERQLRATEGISEKSLKVSLMRLLEERQERAGREGEREQKCCCVCMERSRGAAFIPCGHTFCRVCSRELWLNRGSCPLCNRSIFDILDIF